MYIPVILGTAREGAKSREVANFVLEETKNFGFKTKLIKVGDFIQNKTWRLKENNPKAEEWNKILERSNGFIIISPEYNHSFPGELKMFLDMLFTEYFGKSVGLCGVSAGSFGGVLGVNHLKSVLIKFRMKIAPTHVYFGNVGELFGDDGKITDESFKERLQKMFEEIKKFN